ncbi:hypothetical protein JAAARDRAFT_163244 [Jaapia argillacea MUCL 33604]|uniref:Major facilitator superfamily (MFS) profile domain-containing protein n=1 Tax=Jaapia argillacea MUCL 33604 TaxID=933084 RepID=A0A067PAA0_9AGAM|nr:hypothetical protein JAAARDRAFT_163244 [Jaapia argillacea MUCL 33604]
MAISNANLATPRSSSETVFDRDRPRSSRIPIELDEEIRQDETHFEKYGGDEPREPPPNHSSLQIEKLDPFLVTWDGTDDPTNPQNWSTGYKWAITIICSLLTVNVTFASSAPTAATPFVVAEFQSSQEVGYLITTMFLLGYVVGPSVFGPLSELIGRRPVFLIALSSYTLFHLGQALAPDMRTMLVSRFFGGFFAVAPLTNCGGVIADIWDPVGRGAATSLFTASVFLGPVMGPIVGGFVSESYLGWRFVFWVMMIFAGVCTSIAFIFLPETYAPVLLQKKARRMRKEEPAENEMMYAEHEKQDWSIRGVLHRTLFRPFAMLAMEPILVLVTIYMSVVYGVLYALFESLPIIFIERRGFTLSQNGLIFIGVGLGTTLGSIFNFLLSRRYPALIKKWKGFPPPENRLFGAMYAGPLLVVGSLWLGWSGEYASVPWYVPALSTVLIGMSVSLVFMSFLSYLVDTYLMYSASAFAANTFCRSAVAAAFPLFTVQMYHKLGINWASTLIALIAVVLAPSPFLFYKYGPRIRERSKFAPCIDLKIAKQLEEEANEKEPQV